MKNNLTIPDTIAWLKLHGLPVLPVAPIQDSEQFPLIRNGEIVYDGDGPKPAFTGKNPSYLDIHGYPHLLPHRKYQYQLPEQPEIDRWFRNPNNGIMTMGGWGNLVWIDIDVKRYSSQQSCDRSVQSWMRRFPKLKHTLIERTHSGGWRFAVRCEVAPDFTNFRFDSSPNHRGEILGKGKLTVLAPTIGPSGNPYLSIQQCEPIVVKTLADIGIQPIQKPRVTRVIMHSGIPHVEGVPRLEQLVCAQVQRILNGENPCGDRSHSLLVAALELHGWMNWSQKSGIPISGNPETLLLAAAENLGVEARRLDRILKGQNLETCVPALYQVAGAEAILQKVKRLAERH
jgi:Bifunctional DNA primase/polymerase, N-terminal